MSTRRREVAVAAGSGSPRVGSKGLSGIIGPVARGRGDRGVSEGGTGASAI